MSTVPRGVRHTHIADIVDFDGTVNITVVCPFCSTTNRVTVPSEHWRRYVSGEHVQHAFPLLSIDDAELVLSGICFRCWDVDV